ncbi:MAG: hypothetical protein AAFQ94_20750 [Bacteroidota bacterium]
MSFENKVSIVVTEDEKTQLTNALGIINGILDSKLVTLTVQERREYPKMSDGTVPFVRKALEYATSNPEFIPKFVDSGELKVDIEAVDDLNNIIRPINQLKERLDDSILLSGSEAYVAALAYYNTVKVGAKMNVPGAKAIANDLKKRFMKNSGGSAESVAT